MPYEHREYPAFSWSHSRDRTFRECPRKYYYHYYASHNGWEIDAPESARRAYRLKNLTSLPIEVGAAIHEAASIAIHRARSGGSVPTAEDLYAIVRKRLNQVWKQSEDSDRSKWERSPKQWRIFHEFYYGNGIDDDKRIEAQDRIKRCLRSLLRSVSFREAVASQYIEIKDGDGFTTIRTADTDIYAEPDLIYQKADRTWMIIDWKTGARHDDEVNQAQVYALYLRERYKVNESDITVRIEYLDNGETQELSFTQEDFENNIAAIRDSIADMRSYLSDVAANAPLEKAKFPLQITSLCRFCNFYELDRDEIENKPAVPDDSRIEGPKQAVAATKDEADANEGQHTQELTAHDSCIEELNQKLGAAQKQHEQALAAVEKKHSRELSAEKTQANRERKKAKAANERRKRADAGREKAERDLDAARNENKRLHSRYEGRIENLEGRRDDEVARARGEERRNVRNEIDVLNEELAKARIQLDQEKQDRKSDNERIDEQLADVIPETMRKPWELIHKNEPISAYIQAANALESALRAALGDQDMKLYDMITTAFAKRYITRKQFNRLDRMREERRNIFTHYPEDEIRNSDPLGEREARDAVAYLGHVVALLHS